MDGSLRQWADLGTVACSCVVSGSCTNTTGGSVSLLEVPLQSVTIEVKTVEGPGFSK